MSFTKVEAEGLADHIIELVRFHHSRREYLPRDRLAEAIAAYPDRPSRGNGNGIIPLPKNAEPCVFDEPA